MRRLVLFGMLTTLAPTADVRGEEAKTDVTVISVGPKAFRVRLRAVSTIPCDDPDNARLFEGLVQPGETLRLKSPRPLVCLQQTFDDWPDIGWGPWWFASGWCQGWGGRRDSPTCAKGDGTIRITLRSTPPKQ
jgi:hypothetical protein